MILQLKIKEMIVNKCVLKINKLLSDYVERINRITKTQVGGTALIDSRDYMYIFERKSKKCQNISWQCRSKIRLGCKARATTRDGLILRFTNEHNHPPPELDDLIIDQV